MSTVNNEGNLIFDSVEANGQKVYVAEFKATGPFSLHIERRESGRITVYQKSYENGKYATVKNVDIAPQDTIIDAEVPGGVFPKWIKIKSSSEVEVAEVTFEDAQSGGGAGTAEPEIVYLTEANGIILEAALPGPSYLAKYKNGDNIVIGPIVLAAADLAQGTIQATDFIAVAFFKTEVYFPDGSVMSFDEFISFMTNAGANLIEITKEQFYNLEA